MVQELGLRYRGGDAATAEGCNRDFWWRRWLGDCGIGGWGGRGEGENADVESIAVWGWFQAKAINEGIQCPVFSVPSNRKRLPEYSIFLY